MNVLKENATIGSLVAKSPEYASVFEKLGIDYCCKGHKQLKEVCEEKNLDIHEVIDRLKQIQTSTATRDWDQMSTSEIATHIIDTYHTHLRDELPRISYLINKVHTKHGHRYPYIAQLQTVFEEMKDSLLEHIDEEEKTVFPLIIKQASGQELSQCLSTLDEDHLQTGQALEKIQALTNGYTPPEDACMTHMVMVNSLKLLELNLHEHIHMENHILFPRVKNCR